MKFNKYNLNHYLIFLFSLLILIFLLPTRLINKKLNKNGIILYGHKLYGNLLSIYDKKTDLNSTVFYLTLDKKYYKLLKNKKINVLYGLNLFDVIKVINCKIFICDHGLHFYKILIYFKNIIFIDTNHGIPYHKDALNGINYFKNFDEVWLMSNYHKKLFEKFNYSGKNLKITGYGRLDELIQFTNKNVSEKNKIVKDLKKEYQLNFEKIVLLAPTWVHNRNILKDENYPFNKIKFFHSLSTVAAKENFLIIYRPHINDFVQKDIKNYFYDSKNLALMEFKNFTNTVDFLKIADILITDWSSIALDFIVLDRPVLFIDIMNPFNQGTVDDKLLRFGEIVHQNLINFKLTNYINNPMLYFENNINQHEVKNIIHDIGIDGNSANRYVDIINYHLKQNSI